VHGDICVGHVKGLERHATSEYGHYWKWRAELDCIAAAAKKCELPMADELSKCVCCTHTKHKAVGNICKSTMTRYEPCSRVFSSSPSLPLLCSACTSRCRGEAAYAEAGSSVKGRQYGPVIERRVQSWPCSSRRSGSSRLEPKVGSEVVSSQEGLDVAPTFPTDIRARTRSDIGLSVDGEAGTTSATAQIVES
jgi:hypothetical protein